MFGRRDTYVQRLKARVANLKAENEQLTERLRIAQEENEFAASALARMNLHMQTEAIIAKIRRDGMRPERPPEKRSD